MIGYNEAKKTFLSFFKDALDVDAAWDWGTAWEFGESDKGNEEVPLIGVPFGVDKETGNVKSMSQFWGKKGCFDEGVELDYETGEPKKKNKRDVW